MLTAARLREVLSYDPETGAFAWREARGRVKSGDRAGTQHAKGYWQIGIDGRYYLAHRLAWLYVHGVWPADEVDHKHRVRDDNRIGELREATHAQNHQNRGSDTGVRKGKRGGYQARIQIAGKQVHLGMFATCEEAIAARLAAKVKHHPFFVGESA